MHTAGASPARGPPRSPTRSRDATPLTSAGTAAASGFESPLAQHLYNGFLVGSLSDVRVRAFDRESALRDPALTPQASTVSIGSSLPSAPSSRRR